ncbi:phosphate transporter [Burkholderia sp. BCC1640]|uniref:phosphate transporter n=1 Tax=Burkholderia sp. BCC1640 TaxID=2676294 RepID=UPI001589878C|nr:phosphate transporter [Burkholderia sp. BCC1640]
MPNLAATETRGAGGRSTRTIGLASFFPSVACGIVHVGARLSADPGPVKERSVLPIVLRFVALSAALYWAIHTLF